MAIKLECDLCGKLVTESKEWEDRSVEEWEDHAERLSSFITCTTVCGQCFATIRVVMKALLASLERIRPLPTVSLPDYAVVDAVAAQD